MTLKGSETELRRWQGTRSHREHSINKLINVNYIISECEILKTIGHCDGMGCVCVCLGRDEEMLRMKNKQCILKKG